MPPQVLVSQVWFHNGTSRYLCAHTGIYIYNVHTYLYLPYNLELEPIPQILHSYLLVLPLLSAFSHLCCPSYIIRLKEPIYLLPIVNTFSQSIVYNLLTFKDFINFIYFHCICSDNIVFLKFLGYHC